MEKVQNMPTAFYESRLLSIKQIQEMMGISRQTLWRLVNSKRDPLPSVMIRGNRKFKLDQVNWWIDSHAA